jgi:hypothetical protein
MILIGTTNCECRSTRSPCRHLAIITLKVVNEDNEQSHFFFFLSLFEITLKVVNENNEQNHFFFFLSLFSNNERNWKV